MNRYFHTPLTRLVAKPLALPMRCVSPDAASNPVPLNQAGFGLVELMSIMVVTALFSGLIISFGFNYWRYAYLLDADLTTYVDRLNTGDYLREALGSSSGLIIQNSIADANTHNPDPAIPTNLYWEPNHAIPGNKPVGSTGTKPLLYFKRFSVNTTGSIIMNGEQPYEDEYIVYLNGATKQMLVRALANPDAPGNRLKTSCPPASATTSCPADKVLLTDLASVDLRYFSRAGNLVDYTSVYDANLPGYIGPDFTVVEVVELTLNIAKKPVFQKTNATQSSTIIRIALRNT